MYHSITKGTDKTLRLHAKHKSYMQNTKGYMQNSFFHRWHWNMLNSTSGLCGESDFVYSDQAAYAKSMQPVLEK